MKQPLTDAIKNSTPEPAAPISQLPRPAMSEEALLAKAAADKVRAAAEKAKADGTMSGTTKPAGPEAPTPAQPSVSTVMRALDQLLGSLGGVVDSCDAHFIQNPLHTPTRHVTEEETLMLMKRRHALVVMRQVRDAAQSILDACGPGPNPFGS
jgi:hypothetical protein